ncbi:MAG: peptidylprolyl isomerase [Planctomycetota bacterium]|jgi:peptidyl-prolyl cis-trans isomerase B (cyclophilin B)
MTTASRLRRAASAALVLALGTGLLASEPAVAKDPPVRFRASVDGVKKGKTLKVELGKPFKINLEIANRRRKSTKFAKIRLGAPSSITLEVRAGGRPAQVARLFGSWSGANFTEATQELVGVKGGKKIKGSVELLAVKTGKWTITPVYGGIDPKVWPDPVRAKKLTVEVVPAEGGEKRVGARLTTSLGVMEAELYPEKAFNTVYNFLKLANDGFYDGKLFHRCMKDFMVQTGCPNGNGSGNPGYYIPAEFNDIKHEKGVLSMARQGNHVNTAGCQFFVMHGTSPGLDGKYSGYGRLIKGEEILDALANVKVKDNGQGEKSLPLEMPRLEKVEMILLP